MKPRTLLSVSLLGLLASAPAPRTSVPLTGDYVEARTASVFCGACHYNGELVTEGRDAILAWNMTGGSWNGVDLTGVRAMAEVSCEANLSDTQAMRRCDIVIDTTATDAQVSAMGDWIKHTGQTALGQIQTPHRASIAFRHDGNEYNISAPGFADMIVDALPNNECCTQPHLVWYTPLMAIDHRKVGYTQQADYTGDATGSQWERSDENSAFYGTITANPR